MANKADVKKAKTLVENAQKACEKVLGGMVALSFMPIMALLNREEARVNAEAPYEGLTHEEVDELKAKETKEAIEKSVEEANTKLAEIIEARTPKPKKAEPEETEEADPGDDDPDRLP